MEEFQSLNAEYQSRLLNPPFKPIKVVGRGAFGYVFEVEEILCNTQKWRFAIKRIALKSERERTYASREVTSMLAFNHPRIVRYYDSWIEKPPDGWQIAMDHELFTKLNYIERHDPIGYRNDSDFLFIKMELCQGNLAERLKDMGYRDVKEMKNWFKQIVTAVAYIHAMGRIHRDLKPHNIFFADDHHLKVGDLGIITDSDSSNDGCEISDRSFNMYNGKYRAPEQKGWEGYDNKVDVFALGLILAELCQVMSNEEAEQRRFACSLARERSTDRPNCDQIIKSSFLEDTMIDDDGDARSFESQFIKKFDIEGILGGGYFGTVFKARHKLDSVKYALKRIPVHPRTVNNQHSMLAHLNHPGIVRYHTSWCEFPPENWEGDYKVPKKMDIWRYQDLHRHRAFYFLQMELCESALSDWLATNITRELSSIKAWFQQIVGAVGYIHDNRIIHRNLKPSNILFWKKDHLKIGDLDTATMPADFDYDDVREPFGTPLYMAPEQVGNNTTKILSEPASRFDWLREAVHGKVLQTGIFPLYNFKVDIFSLGLIFTELCNVMSEKEREDLFLNFRCGMADNFLGEHPQLADFVAWLTNEDPYKRPCCEEILKHEFLTCVLARQTGALEASHSSSECTRL